MVARSSTLMDLHGIGPSGAARLLADVGTLHIMAVVQLRNRTEGRAYFDAKKAAGKASMEAMP
ncbi:hypothetical protein U2F26_12495 [Micromonospora sp. 4G57]|uniref:Helix-hairpin-helix domain-containing protein n=1 Tax=Micromonospora sicca TaxID=2202420 RepID=A0ABU5J8U8_9ACTN|nr:MULTISPECIES: hypothetical protein [unclassified Micromonospora]MDZ5443549.1 hypothetical protein [Micromonospora sp. 4G57]MDZ5488978.1 hypothetical protein [Micromonospora sp. 4G53]